MKIHVPDHNMKAEETYQSVNLFLGSLVFLMYSSVFSKFFL